MSHDDDVIMTGTHLNQAVPKNEVEGNANGQKQVKYRRLDSERREEDNRFWTMCKCVTYRAVPMGIPVNK